MVDIYGEIIDKAVKLLRKSTTSKDLVNIANVIKIAEQRQFVLLMIREDKDSGQLFEISEKKRRKSRNKNKISSISEKGC